MQKLHESQHPVWYLSPIGLYTDMTAGAHLQLPATVVLAQSSHVREVAPLVVMTAIPKFPRDGEQHAGEQKHCGHEDAAAHTANCPAAPVATAAHAGESLLPP